VRLYDNSQKAITLGKELNKSVQGDSLSLPADTAKECGLRFNLDICSQIGAYLVGSAPSLAIPTFFEEQ
jgi:hypothetical protein